MKRARPTPKTKKPKPVSRKRGAYKKRNARLAKTILIRIDEPAFNFIRSVTELLGLKKQSGFVRLALSRALADLPDLIVRTADLVAMKHILREVARGLGCAETVIDWGYQKTRKILEQLQWTPEAKRTIEGVIEVISLRREGSSVKSVSDFAGTSPARALSPKESTKILKYLASSKSPRNRVLGNLVSSLIKKSFRRRKALFLSVANLRMSAKAKGCDRGAIERSWNDPEMLQFLIRDKSPEEWAAAEALVTLLPRQRRQGHQTSAELGNKLAPTPLS